MNQLAESDENFIPISDTYLNIEQYELFYRNNRMRSNEDGVSSALRHAISKYALIDYMQQQNITLSHEKRQFQRETLDKQLTYDLQDPILKSYFEKMFQDLQISKQEYI